MSININVNGMNYMGMDYAERSEREQRCKNRLLKVREQSKEMAQDLRDKVRIARQEELKKIQKIKEKELSEWKRRRQCQIETQIDCGLRDFANAHIAALEASCEEGESLREEKEEQDLMAACRGRVAMLQEQRKRDKEAEERLLKKKRKHQKTIGIQADFLAEHAFKEKISNNRDIYIDLANLNSESDEENVPRFTSKPNLHKHQQKAVYNPQNYTSNSIDSNNGSESGNEDEIQVDDLQKEESELEFDQITNLLKQRMQEVYDAPMKKIAQAKAVVVNSSESSSSDVEIVQAPKTKKTPIKTTKKVTTEIKKASQKGILKTKKSPSKLKATTNTTKKTTSPKKSKTIPAEANRVHYVDFTNNKYQSTYVPPSDLVTRNEPRHLNAREEAQIHNDADNPISYKINDDILRELNEIRSYEALQREKIRRDYDRLRFEMDELSKQEQEIRSKSSVNKPISRDQLLRKEENRQKKMNAVVENALKKNVITCPPVARENTRSQTSDVNVAAPNPREEKISEVNNLIKVEKLKDLLEKINHQKRLILNELEKRDDEIPGPDLEKVIECLDKLEKEKAMLDAENKEKLKKFDELSERERKVKEREIRLESNLRELFKKQQQKETQSTSTSISPVSTSSESSSNNQKIVAPPVEIIIKVQHPTKSPRKKKSKKSIRCLDTPLSKGPGKIYPKTPIKRKSKGISENSENNYELQSNMAKTITSDVSKEPSKPTDHPAPPSSSLNQARSILKKSQPSDESSSTSYRSLPEANLQPSQKSHHNLNPALMHYITRLLGMSTNIGNQLNVNVSSVTTPGSSTINTSGNNSAIIIVEPALFDVNRMAKLQQFIDDNYSFLDEINETLESVEQEQINEKRMEGIWRDVLNKKKPQSMASGSVIKSTARDNQGIKDTRQSIEAQSSLASKSTVRPARSRLPSNKNNEASTSKEPTKSTASKTLDKEPSLKISLLRPTPQPSHQIPTNNRKVTADSNVLNNYAEYTANCQRKIADLTRMMEQVRQEKLKLIENSLSSNEYNNFTEYKEIQVQGGDQKDSPSQKEDPPSEEINNILQRQTRPFGVSKDSGISGSRPLTSSDYRDSPDAREDANVFQPINKAPKVRIITPDGEHETVKDLSQVIKQQAQKPQRPPLSLKSFSPQIEKQHEPHELSTIAEIETPTASKTNIVPDDGNIASVSNLHSFPDFDQYAQDIGEHHFTIQQAFPELGDLQNALPDIHIETFVNPRDYNLDEISKDEGEEVASNDSSLMDIMEEMKKRRIIDKSFEILNDDSISDIKNNQTPKATIKISQPQSPRRPPPQSRVIITTPQNTGGNIQIDIQQTPTKRQQTSSNVPDSPSSNDTLSGIQEIEKDLKGAGLSWAAKLLRKNEEAKKQQQKSSSSSDMIEIEFDAKSSSSDGVGKPINLKEFLRRELMTKSINNKYLSDDTSWSSQFMRSLLNASSGSTNSNPISSSSQNVKLRTSTPVDIKSIDRITEAGKTATSSKQLFLNPGAESVSTVRDSGASGSDKSENK